jgi:hypothetical protein
MFLIGDNLLRKNNPKISLNSLKYEEAVSAFLKVKPEPKQPKGKRNAKANRNASR